MDIPEIRPRRTQLGGGRQLNGSLVAKTCSMEKAITVVVAQEEEEGKRARMGIVSDWTAMSLQVTVVTVYC